MNLYFLSVISDSKKGRRESIRNCRLPNGKEEGRKDCNQRIIIWKRGKVLFSYHTLGWDHTHVNFDIELRINNSVRFGVEVDENVFHLLFNLPGFPNRIKYYTNIYFLAGFQSVLNHLEIDKISFSRKNFIRRTMTPILIDELLPRFEEEDEWE
jgi:hypothetical protein